MAVFFAPGKWRQKFRRRHLTDAHLDAWTQSVTEHNFAHKDQLGQALSHRSWCAENRGQPSNERLEFLGDAILQWIVTDLIYVAHPNLHEGSLTDLRKSLVNAETLATIANEIGLGQWLRLGVGEDAAGGRHKVSILADALEALIGALYIDAGAQKAQAFVARLMGERILVQAHRLDDFDARSHLIRICVREYSLPPVVQISSNGAAHEPTFTASVMVNGETLGQAVGRTKKAAAQAASTVVLTVLAARGVDTARA